MPHFPEIAGLYHQTGSTSATSKPTTQKAGKVVDTIKPQTPPTKHPETKENSFIKWFRNALK